MNGLWKHRAVLAACVAFGTASEGDAQSSTPPKGQTSLTALYQLVDNSGHRLTDGFMLRDGQSVSTGALVEVEHAFTDRFAATAGLPFIMAKYRGVGPTPANLPVDSCRCWHSGFADFSFGARYRLGGERIGFAPALAVVLPSHAYNYQGEAVLGRRLKELKLGGHVGFHPERIPRVSLSGSYFYSVVEKAKVAIPNNRSNASIDLGYALGPRWSVQTGVSWQRTHGGLLFGSIRPGTSLPFPGEVGWTGPKFEEHDRLLRDNHWKVNGIVSRGFERFDLFAAISVYVAGTDAHDGQAFTVGTTWYFGGPSAR